MNLRQRLRLFLILETAALKLPLADFLDEVTAAGITAAELRDKGFTERERFKTTVAAAKFLRERDVLFIVNNSVDIAVAAGADGVHLGHSDFPPEMVKPIFGKHLVVGASCNTVEEADTLSKLNIDYLGVGPVFATATKKDHRPPLSVSGLAEILKIVPPHIPSAAIGGINETNARRVMETGAAGVCVSQAICASPTPYDTVKKILAAMGS